MALAQTTPTANTATTTPTTPTTPDGNGWHRHHDSVLTADERAQLEKARQQVFASDPALKTEQEGLFQQFKALRSQGSTATDADKTALKGQFKAYETKMRAAELAVDSTLAPIFAKLDAAHQNGRHSQ